MKLFVLKIEKNARRQVAKSVTNCYNHYMDFANEATIDGLHSQIEFTIDLYHGNAYNVRRVDNRVFVYCTANNSNAIVASVTFN